MRSPVLISNFILSKFKEDTYNAWVITPPCPHPLPYYPLCPLICALYAHMNNKTIKKKIHKNNWLKAILMLKANSNRQWHFQQKKLENLGSGGRSLSKKNLEIWFQILIWSPTTISVRVDKVLNLDSVHSLHSQYQYNTIHLTGLL
jgi:hypothetical protein